MIFIDETKTSAERMIEMLPAMYQKSRTMNVLMEVRGAEISRLHNLLDDVTNQYNIDTATWSLPLWEQEYGVDVQAFKPIEERRAVVKAKMKKSGRSNAELIRRVTGSYTNAPVEISFKGRIEVKLIDAINFNVRDLYSNLRKIVPSHLDFIISIMHDRSIEAERQYERWIYPFLRTNTFRCGTVPHQATLGLWEENSLDINQSYDFQSWQYRLSGKVISGTKEEVSFSHINSNNEVVIEVHDNNSILEYQMSGVKAAAPKQIKLLENDQTLLAEGRLQQSLSRVYQVETELSVKADQNQWMYYKSGRLIAGNEKESNNVQTESTNNLEINRSKENTISSYPITGEVKTSKEVKE